MVIKKGFILLSLIVLLLFSSCNIFIPLTHGRENPEDQAAQIKGFSVVSNGDKSAVTMWDWREPPDWLGDGTISEIHIQHSILGYPGNSIPFLGETFSDKDVWEYEWKDLDPDYTHYFSLFAKSVDWDGNDVWYAPIKAKVDLKNVSEVTGVNYSVTKTINVNEASFADVDSAILDINYSAVAVVYFDFDNSYTTQATLIISITNFSNSGDAEILPLSSALPEDDMDKWNQLKDNVIVSEVHGQAFSVTGNGSITLDITEIVKFSPLNPVNGLLIRTRSGSADFSLDNNASAPVIMADVIR